MTGAALLGAGPALAKKEDVKVEGRIGLGMQTRENAPSENLYEVRMGFETRRKNGAEANVEFRVDEDSRDVSINDAFMDWKSESKRTRWRFGRAKKILGWEYQYSTSARLSIKRSRFSGYLGERALVGRDYFVEFQRFGFREAPQPPNGTGNGSEAPDEGLDSQAGDISQLIDPGESWRAGLSAHFDETRNYALILNALWSPGERWRTGAWLYLHRANTIESSVLAPGAMVSALYQAGAHRAALELFAGRDPYRTALEEIYAGDRSIHFAAARAEYGVYLGPWNPYAVVSVILRELPSKRDREEEAMVGLKYFFWEKLSLAGELSLTRSQAAANPSVASYRDSEAAVMGRYFF